MKFEQNPFSIYDFLGYLIPGLLFSYSVIFILNIDLSNPLVLTKLNLEMDQYFVVIILSYLIGHILSFLSSITVELFSIWTLGYPSRYILRFNLPGFWGNIRKEKKSIRKALKYIMVLYIFPVAITDLIIRRLCKITNFIGKSVDILTADLIKQRIVEFLCDNYEIESKHLPLNTEDKDYFNVIYHYTLEHAPAHGSKFQNYVALYGFIRTICFSIITLLWIIIINGFGGEFSLPTTIIVIGLYILAAVTYLDFNKFFRKYSLEALMAFVTLDRDVIKPEKNKIGENVIKIKKSKSGK